MAIYPTFGQDIDSTETLLEDIQVDRASNGSVRLRGLYSTLEREFSVTHTLVIEDKIILETFYNDNKNLSFSFTWNADNTEYTCMFSAIPTFAIDVGGYWKATSTLSRV